MKPSDEDQAFVIYNELLYVHMYTNIKPIIPFDIKGQVKLFDISKEIQGKIKFYTDAE
jgi:hypothetical protein